MKYKNNDMARHVRVRAALAYPTISVALVVSAALVFAPSPVMALAATSTPTATAAPIPTLSTPVATPSTTSTAQTTSTTAPSATSTPPPAPSATPSPVAIPSAASSTAVTPGVLLDHHVLAWIQGPGVPARYLPIDAQMSDASPFQMIRVRFKIHNAGTVAITASPQLEYRPDGSTGFTVVPKETHKGVPLHIAREWVPSPGPGGGTVQGPLGEDIPVAKFLTGDEGGGLAMTGHHSMGANPDQPVTLPPASYTEQEFTVRLTMDAKYLTGYQLRITDGHATLAGAQVAEIRLGQPPAMQLSPDQHPGVAVDGPKPSTLARTRSGAAASSSAGSAFPTVFAASSSADSALPAASSASPATGMRYPLVASTLSTTALASSDIHGPYSMTADQCGICHRGHSAQTPNLLVKSSQSTLCLTCHDGTGASVNVQAQYALTRPANNSAAREYYSHDAMAPSTHTRSDLDEFGGVSNRHSECADCHNSHKARSTDSTQSADGWDASGRLAGVSGVSVVNGAAGAAPTYTFLDGVNKPITTEYQLCFKCHSGFTTLTSNTGLKPSQYALDKGVEFNPNNASFHPVEAAGTNQTAKMAENLAGTSPYKLWNFTPASTIRCLNCHASSTTPDPTATPPPAAGGALPPHTSSNRGILLRNYQDRVLKSTNAAYSAGDFALCYVCHGEEPFKNDTANATNFSLHGLHLTGLAGKGARGTDIDIPGDGQGNAICAECHFRLHSTTNKVGGQVVPGSRLVNFAPNVLPNGAGTLSWTPSTSGGGSCTLTCHGYEHKASNY